MSQADDFMEKSENGVVFSEFAIVYWKLSEYLRAALNIPGLIFEDDLDENMLVIAVCPFSLIL